MEERQVSIDGISRPLPQPFFVIATQNPQHQIGTYALPEAQLDRFLMCISLGYPDRVAERALLAGQSRRDLLQAMPAACSAEDLLRAQHQIRQLHCSEALLDYLQALLEHSRHSGAYVEGLSPRAGLALLAAARAWAWFDGRDHVIPEDLQSIVPAVASHRLQASANHPERNLLGRELAANLVRAVPLP
jgi:MoxR-like ATPase